MTAMMSSFMSRNGVAAMEIARLLLGLEIGSRLPRARDLAQTIGCGNGTVQAGLQLLEQSGAIQTTSHGSLGTCLDGVRRDLLWELGGLGTLTLAMPLPYSRRYEGIATGLREVFGQLRIPFSLVFMRGASDRSAALLEGRVDIAVMSGLAFENLEADEPLHAALDLGPQTYVGSHGVILTQGRAITDSGLRVAVDNTSIDQVHLVDIAFKGRRDIVRVELSYTQLGQALADGTVDATVWNLDEVRQHIKHPVTILPLDEANHQSNTHAMLVVTEESRRVPDALVKEIDPRIIRQVLDDVLTSKRLPSY